MWNNVLLNIPHPGAVHTSGLIYIFGHILLYCWSLECPSTGWILCSLRFWQKRLTDGGDTLMSSASLSVTGQDEPTCNISTNKVIATSIEGNVLAIHHVYTPVLLNHFLPCCRTHS